MDADSTMHTPERICAVYSRGPHFVRMLKRLRAEYPDEILVAALPTTFPVQAIAGLADETLALPPAPKAGAVRHALHTIGLLRKARCSHIVIMFDSPRLNILARLSGASKRWCYPVDGRLKPLTQPLFRVLAAPAWLRLRGEMDYLRARLGSARRSRNSE